MVKSLFERAAAGEGGAGGAQSDAGFEDVGVVAAFGGIFAPEEDVRVGVDEAGEDGGVGEVDDVEAGDSAGVAGDFYDAVILDEDELVFERRVGGAVDQGACADDGEAVVCGGWRLGLRGVNCGGECDCGAEGIAAANFRVGMGILRGSGGSLPQEGWIWQGGEFDFGDGREAETRRGGRAE